LAAEIPGTIWSHGLLPYRVAAVQFWVGISKSARNLLAAIGVLVGAGAIGIIIGAVSAFPPYWPVFPVTAVLIIIAEAASAVVSYPHRTQVFIATARELDHRSGYQMVF